MAYKSISVCGVVAICILAVLQVGCQGVSRKSTKQHYYLNGTNMPFPVLKEDPIVGPQLGPMATIQPDTAARLTAYISDPAGEQVRFDGARAIDIKDAETASPIHFMEGIHPFAIETGADGETVLSGAMVILNVDRTLELATFGLTEDTKLFTPEMLEKAWSGVLAHYTISFEGQPVIVYWLGNRKDTYVGGAPTAELDFSGTQDIATLWVGGQKLKGMRCTVPAAVAGGMGSAEYEFMMETTGGKYYRGYIRNLAANPFTAFVSVPCMIPTDLLQAADRGTVARMTIRSEGDEGKPVAELVFGRHEK